MADRERKPTWTLKVRVTYEPSRLSPEWVAQAYAQVVPIARRPTPPVPATEQAEPQRHTQPVGRRSAS